MLFGDYSSTCRAGRSFARRAETAAAVDLTLQIQACDRKLRLVDGDQIAIEKLRAEVELLRSRRSGCLSPV